jgi:GntR family transcriptional regulator
MYLQIIEQIKLKIVSGDWPAGQSLPSIRELAASTKVSVITVKRAYFELEREGVIVTRQGKGSFVAESEDLAAALTYAQLNQHLQGLFDAADKTGLSNDELMTFFTDALNKRNAE